GASSFSSTPMWLTILDCHIPLSSVAIVDLRARLTHTRARCNYKVFTMYQYLGGPECGARPKKYHIGYSSNRLYRPCGSSSVVCSSGLGCLGRFAIGST